MNILLLMSCIGSIAAQMTNISECSTHEDKSIPTNLDRNTTVLNLAQKQISLDECDRQALNNYPNLTELNLSDNNITGIPDKFFSGLSKLEALLLRNNSIHNIGERSFDGLENLNILDLSSNQISGMDITQALKTLNRTIKVRLYGNPWNCDCSLLNLSAWLNEDLVILENEASTLCATPQSMQNLTIKALKDVASDQLNCTGSMNGSVTSAPALTSALLATTFNGTSSPPKKGNTWRFLVGVLIVGIITSLLILFAIKFPRWYDYLLSYNHHRLKEEEPYMFEEEFNVDEDISTVDKNMDADKTIVIFEQTHSFVEEDDGFIEDKYIDERIATANS
ncbi:leucine-rich repeat-containing protein 19 [Spea bombifrons]|uniref:leucine-rich repeat-containing protein 19 n=1 Tax=Spea bombifrons TaxID=233779 RepID=UPI00234AF842|nr:leucine-rich repeat-containing protein 19 [Spea bombifrons]